MKKLKVNKWIQLIILSLGAGAIYQFPYLRYGFYVQLQNALGLNNLQYGLSMSVYAVVAMICYFPGGWLADRVSPKKLIIFSLLSTGLSGFYFATFPNYIMNLILNGVWGLTTILTYWAALMKITRSLGDEKEQGRLYGFLEGSRGLFSALAAFVLLAILTRINSNTVGMAAIIRIMAGLEIVVAVLTIFLVQDSEIKKGEAPNLKDIGQLIRKKEVWLISGVIFTSYSIYAGMTYVAPFLQYVYGASENFATTINIFQRTVMMFLGGVIGGFIADKIGSRSKVMLVSYIILIATTCAFVFLRPSQSIIWISIGTILLMALAVYSLRGLYFSLTGELKMPLHVTGTVVGFSSFIGYLPDIFVYPIIGDFLDKYDGNQGYVYMYALLSGISILGFIIMILVLRERKKLTKNEY